MQNTTPTGAVRKWARLLDALDRFAFREPDLQALARGWEVGRPERFVRTYRDPRWSTVHACRCGHRVVIGAVCEHCGAASLATATVAGAA